MKKLKLTSGIVVGLLMLWVGSAVYRQWSEGRAAQSAAAQRQARLAAAKPLKVNPNWLVGTWHGWADNGLEITLEIAEDVSSSTDGVAHIRGLGEGCNLSSVAVFGSRTSRFVFLSGTAGRWEMADSLTLSGELETSGMSGHMTLTPNGGPGCPLLNNIPFELSLVEAPAAATTSIMPPNSSDGQTTVINSPPTAATSEQQPPAGLAAPNLTPEEQAAFSRLEQYRVEPEPQAASAEDRFTTDLYTKSPDFCTSCGLTYLVIPETPIKLRARGQAYWFSGNPIVSINLSLMMEEGDHPDPHYAEAATKELTFLCRVAEPDCAKTCRAAVSLGTQFQLDNPA